MKTGLGIIAEEKQKQIDLGYTAEHDLRYTKGELADIAGCYALTPIQREKYQSLYMGVPKKWYPRWWPTSWSVNFWKPTPNDRINELAKAGAFIASEIDRIILTEEVSRNPD